MRRTHARTLALAPLLFAPVLAAGAPDPCGTAEVAPERIVRITGYPSFFFRAFPKSEAVAYIRAGSVDTRGRGLSNYRVDLHEPDDVKREMPITGYLDPVPSPDERIFTHPASEHGDGIAFHSMEPVGAAAQRRKTDGVSHAVRQPAYVDREMDGVYQSVGTLASSPAAATYRVIVDQRNRKGVGLHMRDYDVAFGANGGMRVRPAGAVVPVCKNLQTAGDRPAIQTPMLSKDGRRIAGVDEKTGTTKIWSIGADGTCTEALDLGVATGKVDFSFDGTQIAFHVDSHDSHSKATQFFSGTDRDATKDVLVMTLESAGGGKLAVGAMRRLTSARDAGSGSYYPSFRADGKIVYLRQNGDRFAFHVVDPRQAPARTSASATVSGACEADPPREFLALAALGDLWASRCRSNVERPLREEAALIPLGLDPDACRALVTKHAPRGHGGLPAEALLAACPKGERRAPAPAPAVLGKDAPVIASARELLRARCAGCHPAGSELDVFALTPEQAQKAMQRIAAGDPRYPGSSTLRPMPLGTRLTGEEVDALNGFLIRIVEQGQR